MTATNPCLPQRMTIHRRFYSCYRTSPAERAAGWPRALPARWTELLWRDAGWQSGQPTAVFESYRLSEN